jgi:hypothetical protein
MSARPLVPRLDPEDLDLLISRSLDGDLPAEEEQKLQQILAADPDAARRREELAGVVAALKALPNHEPPFAIATRVNVQVADRVKGLGATWHRFGIYPPPGLIAATLALIVGLVLAGTFMTRPPRPVDVAARKVAPESPVEVFLQSSPKDAPAASSAPEPKAKVAENQMRRQAAAGNASVSREAAGAPRDAERELSEKKAEVALDDRSRVDAVEKLSGEKVSGAAEVGASPSSVAESNAAPAAGAAPAPPAGHVAALREAEPKPEPRWSISIVGPAEIAASWRLKKTPTTAPPQRPVQVLYRLTLDGSGHVVNARRERGPVVAQVDELVRGLLFEPAGDGGEHRELEIEVTVK